MLKSVLVILIWIFSSSAWANSADIRELINSGEYIEAQVLGVNLQTAEGYALAAESLAAQILLGEVDKLNRRSKDARALSEKALALNPDLYAAKLQYALTDGFVTRTSGDITAWRKKLPSKTFEKIQRFRTDYPEDPKGLALEGAWHLGVVRKAGLKNGEKWFGASLSEGQRLYTLARQKEPGDILIETNFAMSLLVLDAAHYSSFMKPVLEAVSEARPVNDLERKIQIRANEVLRNYNDSKRVKKLAAKFLDGK